MKKSSFLFSMLLLSGVAYAVATPEQKKHDAEMGAHCPDRQVILDSWATIKASARFNHGGKRWALAMDPSQYKLPKDEKEESQFHTTLRLDSLKSKAGMCSYEWLYRAEGQAKAERRIFIASEAGPVR